MSHSALLFGRRMAQKTPVKSAITSSLISSGVIGRPCELPKFFVSSRSFFSIASVSCIFFCITISRCVR